MKKFYFSDISSSRFAPPAYEVYWGEVDLGMVRKTFDGQFSAAYKWIIFSNQPFKTREAAANWLRDQHLLTMKKDSDTVE